MSSCSATNPASPLDVSSITDAPCAKVVRVQLVPVPASSCGSPALNASGVGCASCWPGGTLHPCRTSVALHSVDQGRTGACSRGKCMAEYRWPQPRYGVQSEVSHDRRRWQVLPPLYNAVFVTKSNSARAPIGQQGQGVWFDEHQLFVTFNDDSQSSCQPIAPSVENPGLFGGNMNMIPMIGAIDSTGENDSGGVIVKGEKKAGWGARQAAHRPVGHAGCQVMPMRGIT